MASTADKSVDRMGDVRVQFHITITLSHAIGTFRAPIEIFRSAL